MTRSVWRGMPVRIHRSSPIGLRSVSSFQHSGDVCLTLFATMYPQYLDFPPQARVLEVGCAEADWLTPMKRLRPDLHLTGIDWRRCERPGADTVIEGNVLAVDFTPQSFDAVVYVSSLEHIGLGHYDHDPLDDDGDIKAMKRTWDWLTPNGQVYFDVPWNPDPGYQVCGTECRVYDDAALVERFSSRRWWKEHARCWASMKDAQELIPRPTTKNGRFALCACVWGKHE